MFFHLHLHVSTSCVPSEKQSLQMLLTFSYSNVAIELLSRGVAELTASQSGCNWEVLLDTVLSKPLLKAGSAGAGCSGRV